MTGKFCLVLLKSCTRHCVCKFLEERVCLLGPDSLPSKSRCSGVIQSPDQKGRLNPRNHSPCGQGGDLGCRHHAS